MWCSHPSDFSLVLGAIAPGDLMLYYIRRHGSQFVILDWGGLERDRYPVVLWIIGFGGCLVGHVQTNYEDIL